MPQISDCAHNSTHSHLTSNSSNILKSALWPQSKPMPYISLDNIGPKTSLSSGCSDVAQMLQPPPSKMLMLASSNCTCGQFFVCPRLCQGALLSDTSVAAIVVTCHQVAGRSAGLRPKMMLQIESANHF